MDLFVVLSFLSLLVPSQLQKIVIPNLPLEHYPFWLRNNRPALRVINESLCSQDQQGNVSHPSLVYEDEILVGSKDLSSKWLKHVCREIEKVDSLCWGYENGCEKIYASPDCPSGSKGWTNSKYEQKKTFFNQADFGYIKERRLELRPICTPLFFKAEKEGTALRESVSSSLECTSHLRFCRGKYLKIDFSRLQTIEEPMRYRMDVIGPGQINGWNCHLSNRILSKESDHKSPLQSWAPELEHFSVIDSLSASRDKGGSSSDNEFHSGGCDVIYEKPTIIMKLDATVNMYHHFCDFINLYASFHLNASFTSDVQILVWDTMPYKSNFGEMWKAFTRHPVQDLSQLRGKKVCFKDLVLPFLPRMIYGMYYNMPLIEGCHKSGLFHAFNRHTLHRLAIPQSHEQLIKQFPKQVRITILSRQTKYRQILNEDELIKSLESSSHPDLQDIVVKRVTFSHQIPFREQLSLVSNTDILIGMHGAGLTHSLFLPDWGVLYELYNCGDENCYRDLAKLRGVRYMTWRSKDRGLYPQDEGKHPELGAHEKFTNYRFDSTEFTRQVKVAVRYVRKARNDYFNKPAVPDQIDATTHVDSTSVTDPVETNDISQGSPPSLIPHAIHTEL